MKSDFVGIEEADLISSEAAHRRFHPSLLGFHRAWHDFIHIQGYALTNLRKFDIMLSKERSIMRYIIIQDTDIVAVNRGKRENESSNIIY